jgi:hypothetical protein
MTVLLDADVVGDASLVPHALGVAVVDACGPAVPAATPLRLKWPNDVVHRATPSSPARKLCGVLVEREQLRAQGCGRDVLLCGVGIDVDLRGDGAADRVCLAELSGGALDRVALLAALIAAVDRSFAMLADAPSALMERYRSVSDTVGRAVDVVPIAPMRPGPGGSEPIRGDRTRARPSGGRRRCRGQRGAGRWWRRPRGRAPRRRSQRPGRPLGRSHAAWGRPLLGRRRRTAARHRRRHRR